MVSSLCSCQFETNTEVAATAPKQRGSTHSNATAATNENKLLMVGEVVFLKTATCIIQLSDGMMEPRFHDLRFRLPTNV